VRLIPFDLTIRFIERKTNVNEKLQKIMQKVAQLRALAANAGTQAEAETAAAQAESLIAKYQIDEATIETSTTRDEVVGESGPLWSGRKSEQWRGSLCAGLCKDHGCAAVAAKNGDGVVYRIAGRPSDVAIVRYMYAWLTVEIERLAMREKGRSNRNAFRVGAVVGVLAAMRVARKTEVQSTQAGTSAAIVIVSRADESMTYLQASIGGKFRNSQTRSVDMAAFDRGMAAGSNLAPRNALTGNGPKALGSGR
jgi:hypothetical protein